MAIIEEGTSDATGSGSRHGRMTGIALKYGRSVYSCGSAKGDEDAFTIPAPGAFEYPASYFATAAADNVHVDDQRERPLNVVRENGPWKLIVPRQHTDELRFLVHWSAEVFEDYAEEEYGWLR